MSKFIFAEASTRFCQINNNIGTVGDWGDLRQQVCHDRTQRFPVVVKHSRTSISHSQDDSDGVSRAEKAFPKWKK